MNKKRKVVKINWDRLISLIAIVTAIFLIVKCSQVMNMSVKQCKEFEQKNEVEYMDWSSDNIQLHN